MHLSDRLRRRDLSDEVIARFDAKYEKRGPDECWPWIAGLNGKGMYAYGRFSIRRKWLAYAHRVAFVRHSGLTIPWDVFICHTCDNPRCVNPNHLFPGSCLHNIQDMLRKRRKPTKLTPQQVRVIRHTGTGNSIQVGKMFGVDGRLIRSIRAGKIWRHV